MTDGDTSLDDDGDYPPDVNRSPKEVAIRAIAVCCTMAVAVGADRKDVQDWLTASNLWRDLAPSEETFVKAQAPTQSQIIHASWLSERLVVLLWALGMVEELPPADQECSVDQLLAVTPPFGSMSPNDFVVSAKLRADDVLENKLEEIYQLHWEARDAELNNHMPPRPVAIGIIQERHHVLNWITGYCKLDWDEITTDT